MVLDDLLVVQDLSFYPMYGGAHLEGNVASVWTEQFFLAGKNYNLKTSMVFRCLGLALYSPDFELGLLAHATHSIYGTSDSRNYFVKLVKGSLSSILKDDFCPEKFKGIFFGATNYKDVNIKAETAKEYDNCVDGTVYAGLMEESFQCAGFGPFYHLNPEMVGKVSYTRKAKLKVSRGHLGIFGISQDKAVPIEDINVDMSTGKIIGASCFSQSS